MRLTKAHAVAAATTVLVLGPLGAGAADAVTTTVTATTVAGTLTLAGTGLALSVNAAPGVWSTPTGTTALTVTDSTGTTAGWHVTAQYGSPVLTAGQTELGAGNMRVTTSSPTGDALANMNTFTRVVVGTTPATVLNTYGAGATALTGAGVSSATASVDIKVPTTAAVGAVYTGNVVYTVVSG